MLEKKRKSKIVVKSKKEHVSTNVKTKVLLAVFIMVASALIVSGSAWGRAPKPKKTLETRWTIGDVESSKRESPWDEFGNIKAPPYERNFKVGQRDSKFPQRTGPYCQGYPNEVNIKFTQKLWDGGKFIFRFSPGYTGCEEIKILVDGKPLKTFCDEGGHKSGNYCTFKMVKHTVNIPARTFECDEHIITILHEGGDGALWDWLTLKTYELCEPEPCCECDCDNDCDDDCDDCGQCDDCKTPKKAPRIVKKTKIVNKPKYVYKPTYNNYNTNNFVVNNANNYNLVGNQYTNLNTNQQWTFTNNQQYNQNSNPIWNWAQN